MQEGALNAVFVRVTRFGTGFAYSMPNQQKITEK